MLTLESGAGPPLAVAQWNELVRWLATSALTPADLVREDVSANAPHAEQVSRLLAGGFTLEEQMDEWGDIGVWVMSRSDPDYPALFRARLGASYPVLLFGMGERSLLGEGSHFGVTGTRRPTAAMQDYGRQAGLASAEAGVVLVTGNGRGVERAAMLGALDAAGRAVGVVGSGLVGASWNVDYLAAAGSGHLALISHRPPQAPFQGRASTQRNAYVYALSDAALAVLADGPRETLLGAGRCLQNGWPPVYVHTDSPGLLSRMTGAGARPAPATPSPLTVRSMMG